MYRALALKAIEWDLTFGDEPALVQLAHDSRIHLEPTVTGNRVLLDGRDVTARVRESDVTKAASRISIHPQVREWMVARQQEMAVRAALGAGRSRLMRQLLTECVLLAALGSGLGLLVAEGSLRIFLALNPVTHSRLDEASLDPAVLGFAAFIALVTGVVFGLVPALQASRLDLRKSLHEGGRGADGAVRERVRGGLVATEVALALVLLTTAGLMFRSFLRVQAVQPGFRSDSVLVFDLQLPSARYPGEASQVIFFQQLTARLEALPGVRAAGAISFLPLGGGENMGGFTIEGELPVNPGNEPRAERRWGRGGIVWRRHVPGNAKTSEE